MRRNGRSIDKLPSATKLLSMKQLSDKEKTHKYYLKNKSAFLTRAQIWHEKNPEKVKESVSKASKKYYNANKEKIKKQQAERYKENHPVKKRITKEERKLKEREWAATYSKSQKGKANRRRYYLKNKDKYIEAAMKRHQSTYISKKKSAGQILNEIKNSKT